MGEAAADFKKGEKRPPISHYKMLETNGASP
ncbi:unknown [Ruminococcus sp. CAG:403]|nr:unknown [Ruminococcus sp. CAG:403]